MHAARTPRLLSAAIALLAAAPLSAQTIEDGLMMPRGALCTGFLYMYDSWDTYWEGTLELTNGNIGEISSQSVMWSGNYGITDRLNVIAMVPYVWTSASQGVLQGQSGFQDLTLAAKLNVLDTPFTSLGQLRTIVVASGSTALSDYTPDFYPLSIGSASDRFSGRLTLYFQTPGGFYVDASTAYTFRGNVTLNRDSYFTGDAMYLSNEVEMPDVFDYTVSVGYNKGGLQVPISFSQQFTRGGGDIRRQDMPFVSNRMNASRLSALVMYYLPKTKGLAVRAAVGYTVDGRNVGQATSVTGGLMYTFTF
jgi:hypothetical protein